MKSALTLTLVVALAASTALAVPTTVTHQDIPNCCDFLFVPTNVDELGEVIFPANELITATEIPTPIVACPSQPNNQIASVQVSITNLTGRSFSNLWYVADPETTITNKDGLVNGELAFKIDAVGLNQSLVFESINTNGVFEPGEQWDFVIDGFFNTFGLPASQMESIGVGPFSAGDSDSTGSIIASPIPEPTAFLLAAAALISVPLSRRSARSTHTGR
jgi:hypothetical protein